ncbi:hypothetical protein QBC43DRAFT_246406 [Cladorrhinum sp. PSN259]|nr:hypothetical protein QBC43DRAFT_246406 [Cladorrhinum sp. PSN259]
MISSMAETKGFSWGDFPFNPTQTILLLLVVVIILYPLSRALYNVSPFHPLSKIPGPKVWAATRFPFINSLLRGKMVHDIQRLHSLYGPIVRIAPDEVTFSHPSAWADIFSAERDFIKDEVWFKAQPGQTESIVSAIDPVLHSRIRKAISPAFSRRALKGQEKHVRRYVDLLVGRLRGLIPAPINQIEVDIGPWFNFATFDILGDLAFGESFDCLQSAKLHGWVEMVFGSVKAAPFVVATRYFHPLIERWLMKLVPPKLKKMQWEHFELIGKKVERRMNYEMLREDMMDCVIRGFQEGAQGGLDKGEINATFMVLATAGSETTATALSGVMSYLIKEEMKGVLNKVTAEVRGAFESEEEMTVDSLKKLEYLNAVLMEGLRLCPPLPWMLPRRVPPGGAMVCGVWLPGGTPVSIQAYSMNREPRYWARADEYLPERWLNDACSNPKSPFFGDQRHGLQPFSVGPRSCIGQNLAWVEMRLILAKLLWSFDFEAPADKSKRLDWDTLRTFLFVEKRPIRVTIKPRSE